MSTYAISYVRNVKTVKNLKITYLEDAKFFRAGMKEQWDES
jgi:hypothetical protein